MKKLLLISLLCIFSCSTKTLYNIDLNLLSFLDKIDLEQSIVFPPSLNIALFLFPEVELSTGQPGARSQKGLVIKFPSQDILDLNSFSVKLEIEVEIMNNSLTEQITGDRISIYIASPETENIYSDGISIDLINIETILPRESSSFVQSFNLDEEGLLLDVLRKGEFRLGLGIYLTSSANSIPAVYHIKRIQLSTIFSSSDLLSLSE